jgi:hypothetical protein
MAARHAKAHRRQQDKAQAAPAATTDDATGLKKLESELAALLQKLQAFEKQFFGDSFESAPGGQSAGGAGGGSNAGVVGPNAGGSRVSSSAGNTGVVGPQTGGAAGSENVSGIQTDDPRLAQALNLIYSDPDGKKLIDAAKAQGLTRIITNPGLNPDGGAGTQGETLSGPDGQEIQIADPSNADLIQTLAHELGHAATPGDGDSQTEEATVDALGNAIQERLIGRAQNFQLDTGSYSDLQVDNGIKLDLRQLGIVVP